MIKVIQPSVEQYFSEMREKGYTDEEILEMQLDDIPVIENCNCGCIFSYTKEDIHEEIFDTFGGAEKPFKTLKVACPCCDCEFTLGYEDIK